MYSELVMYCATFVQGAGLFGAIIAISFVLENYEKELKEYPADEEVEKVLYSTVRSDLNHAFDCALNWCFQLVL
jgi:hypothetical protein